MSLAVKVKKGFRLDRLDMDRALAGEAEYEARLKEVQTKLLDVQQAYRRLDRRAIIVFEGRDAAGKGGAIKRLVEKLDPHNLHVWEMGPPIPAEQGRHYLFRFWERLPEPGDIAIFDRSWYGRVLVERVEKFTPPKDWGRAYDEINAFEKMLTDDGIRLVKLFLNVSAEEQLRRLRERIAVPVKRWKVNPHDIEARALWDGYTEAIADMLDQTSMPGAHWRIIAADRKWFARIAVCEAVVKVLARDLDLEPPALDPAIRETVLAKFGEPGLKDFGLDS